MGLPYLEEQLAKLKVKYPKVCTGYSWSISTLICLEEFLQFLHLQGLLQPFKSALMGIIAIGQSLVTALQLAISQAQVFIKIMETSIATLRSFVDQAAGLATKFPFLNPAFTSCPIVQKVKNYLNLPRFLPGPEALLPASVKTFYKKLKMAPDTIRKYEYEIYRQLKIIKKLEQQVAQLQAFLDMAAAIVQAIDIQFPGGSGSIT